MLRPCPCPDPSRSPLSQGLMNYVHEPHRAGFHEDVTVLAPLRSATIGQVGEVAPTFGVLGALEVCRDGVPVPLPGGRRRAVLAALLARAGRPVPADALVDAAWGDDLPADPRPALHTVLSRLRGALGHGLLRTGPAGYLLDAGPGALDAVRLAALRARAAGTPAAPA